MLGLAATDKLYRMFPGAPEGKLTSYRSALVNTKSLIKTAAELGLGDFVLLSRSIKEDDDRARQYILACTFEAVVGAIYMDRGFGVATLFLDEVLFGKIDSIVTLQQHLDPKHHFQNMAQERVGTAPHYKTLEEMGPNHKKFFRVGVFLEGRMVAEGNGRRKQEAEQEAARIALEEEYSIILKNSFL